MHTTIHWFVHRACVFAADQEPVWQSNIGPTIGPLRVAVPAGMDVSGLTLPIQTGRATNPDASHAIHTHRSFSYNNLATLPSGLFDPLVSVETL